MPEDKGNQLPKLTKDWASESQREPLLVGSSDREAMPESGKSRGRGLRSEDPPGPLRIQLDPTASAHPDIVVEVATPTTTTSIASGYESFVPRVGHGEDGSDSPPRKKLSSQSYRDAVGGKPLVDRYRKKTVEAEPDKQKESKTSLVKLFRYATYFDRLLMVIGALAAVVHGSAFPAAMLVFGDITNAFVDYTAARIVVNDPDLRTTFDSQVEFSADFLALTGGRIECTTQCVLKLLELRVECDPPYNDINITLVSGSFPDPVLLNVTNLDFAFTLESLLKQEVSSRTQCLDDNDFISSVNFSIFIFIIIAVVAFLAAYVQVWLFQLAAERQVHKIRLKFYRAVLRQDISWFDSHSGGELSSWLTDDLDKIHGSIGDNLAIFIQWVTTFLAAIVVGLVREWRLALVLIGLTPFLAIAAAIFSKVGALFASREQKEYASAGAVAEEVLSSIRTVVTFGGEYKEGDRYTSHLMAGKKFGVKKGVAIGLSIGLVYFLLFATYSVSFWFGGYLVSIEEAAAGDVLTVFFAILIGAFYIGQAGPNFERLITAAGAAGGIYETIDRVPSIDTQSDEGLVPGDFKPSLEVNDVRFSYPTRPDVQVLDGMSFQVKVGQTVALVGASGCGKSTVVQLLQRFYDIDSGEILIGGHDIKQLNVTWLRSNIGLVSQEPILFDTTIAENIRYGRDNVTLDEVETAARAANAHDFILQLPDGYNTQVGERGTQMSGGQKQRIAIARALVRDPKILLLDEATSALDMQSEAVVQHALDRARAGRTTIVIAHRLSTIQQADVIMSLENGRVVEMGTHNELLRKKGLYFELFNAQTHGEIFQSTPAPAEAIRLRRRRTTRIRQTKRHLSTSPAVVGRNGSPRTARRGGGTRRTQRIRNSIITVASSAPVFTPSSALLTRAASSYNHPASSPSSSPRIRPPAWRLGLRSGSYASPVGTDGSPASLRSSSEDKLAEEESLSTSYAPPKTECRLVRIEEKEDEEEEKEEEEEEEEELPNVSILRIFSVNREWWWLITLGAIAAVINGTIFPAFAIIFGEVLEVFSRPANEVLAGTHLWAGVFLVLGAVAAIAILLKNVCFSISGENLTLKLRQQLFRAMLRQEIGWFDEERNTTGALTTRLSNDAGQVQGAAGIRLGTLLETMIELFLAVLIGFVYSWITTLVVLGIMPIVIIASALHIQLITHSTGSSQEALGEATEVVVESVENIETVVAFGLEPRFYGRFKTKTVKPYRSALLLTMVTAVTYAFSQAIIFFAYIITFRFGAFLITLDDSHVLYVEFQDVYRVFAAIIFGALAIGAAGSFAPDYTKAKLAAKQVFAILDRRSQIDSYSPEGNRPGHLKGEIAVNDVNFSYPARPDVRVLQGLSISVSPGQTLALVGPSGCGKSTVVSLIERFYDPSSGSLSLDGKNLTDLNIRWLRSQVGNVSQEPVLFDASVADNVRYGANFREVSDEEVIEAAKAANIHSFIESLPQGYSTNVGAKGTQLSGGQKQRIAIARALVRDPKILLLDEATSALDAESEKIVQEALDKAREGRTSIVIAHRLSTIYGADCIAVIRGGKVVELGRHADLMRRKGLYYKLNRYQGRQDGRPVLTPPPSPPVESEEPDFLTQGGSPAQEQTEPVPIPTTKL